MMGADGAADADEVGSEAPKNEAAEDELEVDEDEDEAEDEGGNWPSWSCTRLFAWSIADAQLD